MKVAALAAGIALAAAATAAPAQTYPVKPVRLVMGPPAGGPTDGVGRVIAARLTEIWGQQVVIENRPGAGNTIATAAVAKAPADGYTLHMCTISDAVAPALYRKLPYDFARDITPIAHVGTTPNVFVVHPSVPARSVREFIALARAQPGKLDYAATGVGQSGHLSFELLKSMTGINVVYVPYKTVGVAVTDILAGRVAAQITNLPAQAENVRAGKVRALGVTSTKRSARLPDVPTIAEAGVPGFEVTVWYGLCAPATTPKAVIDKVAADTLKVLAMPDVRQRLADQGVDAEPIATAPFADFIKADTAKWAKVVKAAGIEPQ